MSPDVATSVPALGERLYPDRTPEIVFHPQCFASHGHFAGDDEARAQAFLDVANDGSYNAVWFARGGYGSCRVVEFDHVPVDAGVPGKGLCGLQ